MAGNCVIYAESEPMRYLFGNLAIQWLWVRFPSLTPLQNSRSSHEFGLTYFALCDFWHQALVPNLAPDDRGAEVVYPYLTTIRLRATLLSVQSDICNCGHCWGAYPSGFWAACRLSPRPGSTNSGSSNQWMGTESEIQLRRGLNALVGERCPGNATVVDALKLVLQDSAGDLARPLYRANHATA